MHSLKTLGRKIFFRTLHPQNQAEKVGSQSDHVVLTELRAVLKAISEATFYIRLGSLTKDNVSMVQLTQRDKMSERNLGCARWYMWADNRGSSLPTGAKTLSII